MRLMSRTMFLLVISTFTAFVHAEQRISVFAAASLTNALGEIAAQFEKATGTKVALSFASSATLAKQIENGAPANIFVSADAKWMDYLQDKAKIVIESRRNLVGNDLVLIAPVGRGFKVTMKRDFDFAGSFAGKLCTGDPASVPVGIYGKAALTSLGWWDTIASRIVGTEDVRAALAFTEKGECAAAIVYATDAKISSKVEVVAKFPESTHVPIVYPIACVKGRASRASDEFLRYLAVKPATTILEKFGFQVIP